MFDINTVAGAIALHNQSAIVVRISLFTKVLVLSEGGKRL